MRKETKMITKTEAKELFERIEKILEFLNENNFNPDVSCEEVTSEFFNIFDYAGEVAKKEHFKNPLANALYSNRIMEFFDIASNHEFLKDEYYLWYSKKIA